MVYMSPFFIYLFLYKILAYEKRINKYIYTTNGTHKIQLLKH